MANGFRIPAGWELPEELIEKLSHGLGRQRAESAEGHLVLVLHEVPVPGIPERTAVRFWRKPDGAWLAEDHTEGLASLAKLLQEYAKRIDELEAAVPTITSAKACFTLLRTAVPLARATRNIHLVFDSARQQSPKAGELNSLQEKSAVADRAAELVHADLKLVLDYQVAEELEEQNSYSLKMATASHKVNLLVTLFLPVTAVASILGMNLRSGLEDSPVWLFYALIAVGITLGFLIRKRLPGK